MMVQKSKLISPANQPFAVALTGGATVCLSRQLKIGALLLNFHGLIPHEAESCLWGASPLNVAPATSRFPP